MNSIKDIVDPKMMLHSERHLAQQFSCMRTNHVRSYDFILLACQHQLDKARRFNFSLRAINSSRDQ